MSSKINLQTCEYARKSSIFQDNQLIWTGNLLNVILYIPLGGTIYNMAVSIKGTAFAALLSSVLCDIIQYFTHRGVADINDVLFNLIGACAGALLFRAFRAFKKKKDLQ